MRKLAISILFAGILFSCKNKPAEPTASEAVKSESSSSKEPPVEILGSDMVDAGKRYLKLFAAGDIDNWVNMYSDNAVYLWSSGDSLVGKNAIANYWKNRRKNFVDSMKILNDIWLPIRVNQVQQIPQEKGTWLLNWQKVNVRYKTGKSLVFWVHVDLHYDDNGKVDRSVHYVDRAPINAATAMK